MTSLIWADNRLRFLINKLDQCNRNVFYQKSLPVGSCFQKLCAVICRYAAQLQSVVCNPKHDGDRTKTNRFSRMHVTRVYRRQSISDGHRHESTGKSSVCANGFPKITHEPLIALSTALLAWTVSISWKNMRFCNALPGLTWPEQPLKATSGNRIGIKQAYSFSDARLSEKATCLPRQSARNRLLLKDAFTLLKSSANA